MTAPTDIPVNGDGTWRSPTWGEGGTYSPSAYEGNGAPQGTLIGPNDFNEPRRNVMRWVRAMRDRTVPSDRGLYASFLMKPSGGWNTGLGTLNGTIGVSYVMVDANDDGGVVVEFAVSAGSPHVFTASRDTYVNLNESGLVEYQAVANGAPAPSPSAGYVAIWKVVTDGTQLTSASVLVPSVPVFKAIQIEDLTVTGDLDVEGDASVGGTLDVVGAVDFDSSLAVAGQVDLAGVLTVAGSASFSDGVSLGASSPDVITVNGTTTFSAPVTVANGVTFTANGNTALGNTTADSHTVTGLLQAVGGGLSPTMTIGAPVGLDPALSVTGGSGPAIEVNGDIDIGTNTITGVNGTVDVSTIDASLVSSTVYDFGATSAAIVDGRVVYDGRRLSVGDGINARVIHSPLTAYAVGQTNNTATDIAGAFVQMVIDDDQWVYVSVSAMQTVANNGAAPTIRVRATNGVDSIAAINNGDNDVGSLQLPLTTAVNQKRPVAFVVRWKPTNDFVTPNNTTWTLQVVHDVTAGNVTTAAVFLQAWYE